MMPAKQRQTIDDLTQALEAERLELIGGEIIKRPMPRPRHGFAQNQTGNRLVLQRHAVPYYWVISPEQRTLIAYRLVKGKYAIMLSAEHDEKLRIEPFAEIEFDLALVFDV